MNTPAFWTELTETERGRLLSISTPRAYEPGDRLFRQGDAPDSVLVIMDGWVKVTASRVDGHEVLLAVRGPYDTLGESGWLGRRARSGTVIALSVVKVLAVHPDRLTAFVNDHARVAQVLARVMLARLEQAERRMASQISDNGPARLAGLVADLAERYGEPAGDAVSLRVPLTQQELAMMIGVSRETVARTLATWRRAGVVSTTRMRINVLDLPELRRAGQFSGRVRGRRTTIAS